jgi:hypothetical protein
MPDSFTADSTNQKVGPAMKLTQSKPIANGALLSSCFLKSTSCPLGSKKQHQTPSKIKLPLSHPVTEGGA